MLTEYLSFGAPLAVTRWQNDGAEAVNGDAKDSIDGAQTDGVVDRQPQVARQFVEHPALSGQQVHRVDRHRNGSNDEVANRQRSDEVVGRLTQRTLQHERQQHHQITTDRRHTDASRQQTH